MYMIVRDPLTDGYLRVDGLPDPVPGGPQVESLGMPKPDPSTSHVASKPSEPRIIQVFDLSLR
jgi:hypothetical protein